ncbi:hypothetical protein BC629DRAFT_1595576 [Irpex lacteus]|nr:hypothetical protein BC629DRAFT_1595576 [Irpex lacteus]
MTAAVEKAKSDQDPLGEMFNVESDLGLDVVRRCREPGDPRANGLVHVPGGELASSDRVTGPPYRVFISRRPYSLKGLDRGLIIMAAVPVMHEMKAAFFYLLQHEGDPYKVTIEHGERDMRALNIKYFDTVHIVLSLCILKSGFLFIAAEFGNHPFDEFQRLGDDDSDNETRILLDVLSSLGTADPTPPFFFVFASCGRDTRSFPWMLRRVLEVVEAVRYDLLGIPNAAWDTELRKDYPFDSSATLSFVNGALVLSIVETIEEVQDTGFLSSRWTLAVQQIGSDAFREQMADLAGTDDCHRDDEQAACGRVGYENQSVRIISVDPESLSTGIVDPATTVNFIAHGESAFSIAVDLFAARGGEELYRKRHDLGLLHKTEMNDVSLAVLGFQGCLVAGVSNALQLYDMGKKKLLRKVENKICYVLLSDVQLPNILL